MKATSPLSSVYTSRVHEWHPLPHSAELSSKSQHETSEQRTVSSQCIHIPSVPDTSLCVSFTPSEDICRTIYIKYLCWWGAYSDLYNICLLCL